MDLPQTVKIGPVTYTVSTDALTALENFPGDLGLCDNARLTINLSPHQSETNYPSTLLHEVLHAVLYVYGGLPPDVDDAIQEQLVVSLTTGLLTFIQDNPEVVIGLIEND